MTLPCADILLATLNARYCHTAFGLRALLANLAELRPRALLREFECHDHPEEVAETLLNHHPRIIALGIYVWNVEVSTRLVRLLKRIHPEGVVVLGGPEVSFETDGQVIVQEADYVICGEGERLFYELCRSLLAGQRPDQKIIRQTAPLALSHVAFPYDEYLPQDIAHRVIYVERSRGCPYQCSFCLSSLDRKVRRFPLDAFLQHMQRLLERGVRHVKFVDRTFNLNMTESLTILEFFLSHVSPQGLSGQGVQEGMSPVDLFVHVEMVPDRLPPPLKEMIQRFPSGVLQFEIGIQSLNPDVQERIHRRQDNARSLANLRWLVQHTDVHLHTDLIVGLPGETLESFASGFNRLASINPHEIQVGILKRLRGAPIHLHTRAFGMVYNPDPPYDLLCNDLLDFATLRRLKRFARYWDMFGNSGRFSHVRTLLFQQNDPFDRFLRLSDWLFLTVGRTHGIALRNQFDWLFRGLTEGVSLDRTGVLRALEQDFVQGALREAPACLHGLNNKKKTLKTHKPSGLPARQARHRSAEQGSGA